MTPEANPLTYTTAFRDMIEDHIPELCCGDNSVMLNIESSHAQEAEGDFYTLMYIYSVPPDCHWVSLRMNGLTSPEQYRHDMIHVLIPRPDYVNALLKRFKTSQSMGAKRKK